jgi:hypothetical protein
VHDIWEFTQHAKVILADLTGKNPNVIYELGLGHASAKPVVLVTESVTDVPFDLRALRMIDYDKNNPDWGEALQEKIRTSILEVLQAPLKSVLPAFLNVRDSKADTSVTEHEREILEIRQEMELLRQEMIRSRDQQMREGSLSTIVPGVEDLDIGPTHARRLIQRYLAQGIPASVIISTLERYGVPAEGAARQIGIEAERFPEAEQSLDNLLEGRPEDSSEGP